MRYNNPQSGFTLIELLIVIGILGMLATIILTSMGTARAKSRDAKRKADMIQTQKALELYYNTNNGYPDTGGLWFGAGAGGCGGIHDLSGASGYIPNLAPTFLAQLPVDPKGLGAGCAGYNYRSNGADYKLISNYISGVGPESFPAVNETFYDPANPTARWMLTNNSSVTSGW
jgi:prepilin-type N-terminal cleavage/methylation domain-containing protein